MITILLGWMFSLGGDLRLGEAANFHESGWSSMALYLLTVKALSPSIVMGVGVGMGIFDSRQQSWWMDGSGAVMGYTGIDFNERAVFTWTPWPILFSQEESNKPACMIEQKGACCSCLFRPRFVGELILFHTEYRYEQTSRTPQSRWGHSLVAQAGIGVFITPLFEIGLSYARGTPLPGIHPDDEAIGYPAYPYSFALSVKFWFAEIGR